jgi:hypothetical protein
MSLNRLTREVAKVAPAIRRAFEDVSFAPTDPWAAMLQAIHERSVRQKHFDAVWRVMHEPLRARLIAEAREYRSERLARSSSSEASNAAKGPFAGAAPRLSSFGAVITILSYLPEEYPPAEISDVFIAECVYPFEILAKVPTSDPDFPELVKGSILMRVIGTEDAMELREEIWGKVESRRPAR